MHPLLSDGPGLSTAPVHPVATASLPPWRRRLALLAVCLGTLAGPLDTTVNTAFPVISAAFALAPHAIQWVVIAFVLTQTSLTLVFGRLGDLFGHRRIFAIGLATCAVAHLAVGLAPDYPTLVAMRVLQGVGVGLVVSCGAALATLMYPPADRQRVLAVYVASTSLAMAVGPWLGGVLIAAFDWPAVFIFRSPLALLVWLALPWVLPAPAHGQAVTPAPAGAAGLPGAAGAKAALAFDWVGAVGLSAVLCAVVLSLAELARPAGRPAVGLAGLGAGLLGAVLWVRHALRTPHPVLRLAPFRSRLFSGVQLASVVLSLASFANLLLLPYVLTRGPQALPIGAAGLVLALYPSGAVIGSLLAGRLGARTSAIGLMVWGMGGAAIGLLATALLLVPAPQLLGGLPAATLGVGMLVCGVGQGLFQVGYMDTTISLLPAQERGVAGSLVSVTRLLGIALGAVGIAWFDAWGGSTALSFAVLGGGLALLALRWGWLWRRMAAG